MIRIANWLLTRKCNLKCDYCAIVKNYENKPASYPDMKYYHLNEMPTYNVIEALEKFKLHNPDMFHIFYGGEPLLRKDLAEIIKFCNTENIAYTIISNNTPEVQPMIMKLLDDTGRIDGFTASVDPVFQETGTRDRVIKSIHGLNNLLIMKKYIKDVVAEITVMKHNLNYLHPLVKKLTSEGINSDVTFIDIAKTPYYDFSNITDKRLLVERNDMLAYQFEKLISEDLDIHMKEILLPEIWRNLPSDMDCEIDKKLHNISIDADGTIRLCLRIRGENTPNNVSIKNLLNDEGEINDFAHTMIKRDKIDFCQHCNHTCQIMSKVIEQSESNADDLIHMDKRSNYGG